MLELYFRKDLKKMGKFDALTNAANKAIDNAYTLTSSKDTPFGVVYKQFKTLQSLWYRVIEDAAETGNSRLEDLCVDLEQAVIVCQDWIKENSPNNKAPNGEKTEETTE